MANQAALAVYSCIDSRCISKCLVILLASQEACNPDTDTPYAVCTASCQAHAVVQALPALLAFCSLLECKQVFQNMPAVVTCMHLVRHLSLCSHHHVNSIIGVYAGHFQWPQHHAVMAKW